MKLGVDLRLLPTDGSAGSGVPQAARELWEALATCAWAYSIELVTCRTNTLLTFQWGHKLDGWIVPSGAVSPWLRGKIYPWVHDVAIFGHPEWFPQSSFQRWRTTKLFTNGLKRAAHIFSVSETTKRDLMKQFGFTTKQITATGEGVTIGPERHAWPKSVPEGVHYILALGTIEPRKNLEFLLEVWKRLRLQVGEDVKLVIAGKEGWGKRLDLSTTGVIHVGEFDNAERDALIQYAVGVAVPSLYEGFGRVALEAMAAGAPVLVSDRGALPEVVGKGGQVLPLEVDAWVAAFMPLFLDEDARQTWSTKGLKRAQDWQWDRAAETMLARIQADC